MKHTHVWVRPYLTFPHEPNSQAYVTWLCDVPNCPVGGAVIREARVPSDKATH